MIANRFSDGFCPFGVTAAQPGAALFLQECARQHADALRTYEENAGLAGKLARQIRAAGRVLLLGMGASHHANCIGAAGLRAAGIDALALPASEALYAAMGQNWPVILTSQSGRSGEIVRWLAQNGTRNMLAGITHHRGQITDMVPSFHFAGPPEQSITACRSFTLTLAVFFAIIQHLSPANQQNIPQEEPIIPIIVNDAIKAMRHCQSIIFGARAGLMGLAGMAALGLGELGRLPALALEIGQLRHGLVEILSPKTGLVLFRTAERATEKATERATEKHVEKTAEKHMELWAGLVEIAQSAGAPVTIFDASGAPPLAGVLTIPIKPNADLRDTGLAKTSVTKMEMTNRGRTDIRKTNPELANIYQMLPIQQAFMLGLAAQHVGDVGQMRFSAKVTEVA